MVWSTKKILLGCSSIKLLKMWKTHLRELKDKLDVGKITESILSLESIVYKVSNKRSEKWQKSWINKSWQMMYDHHMRRCSMN